MASEKNRGGDSQYQADVVAARMLALLLVDFEAHSNSLRWAGCILLFKIPILAQSGITQKWSFRCLSWLNPLYVVLTAFLGSGFSPSSEGLVAIDDFDYSRICQL